MDGRILGKALITLAFSASAALAADLPGTHFAIDPRDLPKPYATPAVDNSSHRIARPDGAVPSAPKGFAVAAYATGLSNPRWMAVAANGDVFLAEPGAGKISLLRGTDKAALVTTFADGFDKPHGLAFHDGALYVGDVKAVWRIPYKDGDTRAGARTRVTKQADLGIGGHFTRDLAFGPDGTLYVAIGSNSNVDDREPAFRAAVDKVNADGSLSVFASGIRNPVGIAFYPGTNRLWVSVNERDGLGDGLVPDYLTHLQPGGFYGWPYAYTGRNPDPVYGPKRPDMVARSIAPDLLFESHSAPTGLVFYEGSQFPAAYKGDAFVSLHGSWNSAKPTGYKVVRVHFAGGRPAGGYDNFLTGFRVDDASPAQVWGRPAGLAVARDGSLLVADDAGKTVWRVRWAGK
ncbi:MAG TPA: PQQ-dependent sugar dehydrogenase [Rhizomicrobium sp.]|nr:PQQ-dependent sugar dehydrogenase [Rhizomicrobium sp.]